MLRPHETRRALAVPATLRGLPRHVSLLAAMVFATMSNNFAQAQTAQNQAVKEYVRLGGRVLAIDSGTTATLGAFAVSPSPFAVTPNVQQAFTFTIHLPSGGVGFN